MTSAVRVGLVLSVLVVATALAMPVMAWADGRTEDALLGLVGFSLPYGVLALAMVWLVVYGFTKKAKIPRR